jgi:enoyl-CoA hydratase
VTQSVLLLEKEGGIATVTLNRPEAMNALSMELRNAISDTFTALSKDEDVKVIILTGAGRAFSAGLDLKELGGEKGDAKAAGEAVTRADLLVAMDSCPQPIIGAVNGVAITGGFEVALGCDVLISSTQARFADTHGRVGVMPGWGLSQKLSRLVGPNRARELSLTGNYLSGKQAEAWGLVGHCVEPEELMPLARQLAADMLTLAPGMLFSLKRVINEGFGMNFADAMVHEKQVSAAHQASVTPEAIAERRRAIQERGRTQQSQA